MNILFLDDNPVRQRTFRSKIPASTIVSTAAAAITELQKEEMWNIVFLDHDLGGEEMVESNREDCGMEVVRWIQENEPQVRNFIVHSHNGPAGMEMVQKLIDSQYMASYLPFSNMIANLEKLNE